jgi:hypothetical protein
MFSLAKDYNKTISPTSRRYLIMEQKTTQQIQQIQIQDQGSSAEHHKDDQSYTSQKTVEELDEENLESIVGGVNPAVKALLADSNKTRSLRDILGQKRPLTDIYDESQLPPKKRIRSWVSKPSNAEIP